MRIQRILEVVARIPFHHLPHHIQHRCQPRHIQHRLHHIQHLPRHTRLRLLPHIRRRLRLTSHQMDTEVRYNLNIQKYLYNNILRYTKSLMIKLVQFD